MGRAGRFACTGASPTWHSALCRHMWLAAVVFLLQLSAGAGLTAGSGQVNGALRVLVDDVSHAYTQKGVEVFEHALAEWALVPRNSVWVNMKFEIGGVDGADSTPTSGVLHITYTIECTPQDVMDSIVMPPAEIATTITSTNQRWIQRLLRGSFEEFGIKIKKIKVYEIQVPDVVPVDPAYLTKAKIEYTAAEKEAYNAIWDLALGCCAANAAILLLVCCILIRRTRKKEKKNQERTKKAKTQGLQQMSLRRVWDVGICYRHSSDAAFAMALSDGLRAKQFKVLINQDTGIGPCWEDAFMNACVHCDLLVVIISTQSVAPLAKLHRQSSLDKYSVELTLALELQHRQVIRGIQPIMIGNVEKSGEAHVYRNYFTGAQPTLGKAVSQEADKALAQLLRRMHFGPPKFKHRDVRNVLGTFTTERNRLVLEGPVHAQQVRAVQEVAKQIEQVRSRKVLSGMGQE